MIYHLQILKDNVSILIDSDIGYYHHLELDDIISVEFDSNSLKLISINNSKNTIHSPIFVTNWNSIKSKSMTIASLISLNYLSDISHMIDREKKLKSLGI